MTHLTLTGYLAGTPICGVNKQDARENGDDFTHYAYAPLDNPAWMQQVCPACKHVLDTIDEDN